MNCNVDAVSAEKNWMKKRREKSRAPILAAGGIVLRGGREPLIAVVQLRKCNSWVLPKGKLNANESALAAARREVLEEVGHKVHVHEFLGTISHDVGHRTKVVQFWRMRAVGEPVGRLARDVKAVRWLPPEEAAEKLSRSREREFLNSIAPAVREAVERSARQDRSAERVAHTTPVEPALQSPDAPIIEQLQPAAPDDPVAAAEAAEAPRDNIAGKIRAWFRRIARMSNQTAR
jgi:8-oxo-dGTP diphosphatase